MSFNGFTRREVWKRLAGAGAAVGLPLRAADQEASFIHPPDDAKMILYYWWFGPSQQKAVLARELEALQKAGVGGVFIFPVYPLSADDDLNYTYLSEPFLEALRFTTERGRELGLTVDLLLGGGWPFGGPGVELARSSRNLYRAAKGARLEEGDTLVAADDARGVMYISRPTRQRVKGAVIGSSGWVLDHLNRGEVERYLGTVAAKLVSKLPKGSLRSLNFDSLEAFNQYWTPDFPAEFQRRRGYDLIPRLAALWDDVGEDTPHVRYDYWRTLADVYLDSFQRPFHAWCRSRGIPLQGKPMGTPINDLRAFADQELAVAEEYDWLEFSGPRWAASGAHVYGQNLVANEGYTWLRQPRYVDTLQDLKVGSDVQFLAGVNVIIGHGFSYSPESTGVPGWSYYAGVYFQPKNTWWPYVGLLMKYVQRVCFILRQGIPVADVAVFLPEDDQMAESAAGRVNAGQKVIIKQRLANPGDKLPQFGLETALHNRSELVSTIVTNGYCFDGLNNDGLQKAAIRDGRLKVGLGDYGVLVLPSITGMPVASMEKIRAFAAAGGKVIAVGHGPSVSYGLPGWRADSERVRGLAAQVFGRLGGKIAPAPGPPLLTALRASHAPDIDFERADPEVGFVHRRTPTHDYYFVANTSPDPKNLSARFRIAGRMPELWDAISGRMDRQIPYREVAGGTAVKLHLEGYESVIVAFSATSRKAFLTPVRPSKALPDAIPISGEWRLEIGGATVPLKTLLSWTADDRFRYFSGSATYRTKFQVAKTYLADSMALMLDLGSVHEIADVEVNGAHAGVAWMAPYRLDISGHVRAGENELAVKVTNLLINKVLGDPKPDTRALYQKFGARFAQVNQKPDLKFEQNFEKDSIKEPLPSGLLGPVAIRPFWKKAI